MENQSPAETVTELDNFFNLSFDSAGLDQLRQIALWSKITSIAAFIGYIFTLAKVIFGHPEISSTLIDESTGAYAMVHSGNILGTTVVVIVGGVINYFLFRFASAVSRGVQRTDALKVNAGFNNLRLYFKITGILLIIALAFVLLLVIVALLGASMAPR